VTSDVGHVQPSTGSSTRGQSLPVMRCAGSASLGRTYESIPAHERRRSPRRAAIYAGGGDGGVKGFLYISTPLLWVSPLDPCVLAYTHSPGLWGEVRRAAHPLGDIDLLQQSQERYRASSTVIRCAHVGCRQLSDTHLLYGSHPASIQPVPLRSSRSFIRTWIS
jgi:hypothetical protein